MHDIIYSSSKHMQRLLMVFWDQHCTLAKRALKTIIECSIECSSNVTRSEYEKSLVFLLYKDSYLVCHGFESLFGTRMQNLRMQIKHLLFMVLTCAWHYLPQFKTHATFINGILRQILYVGNACFENNYWMFYWMFIKHLRSEYEKSLVFLLWKQ